MNAKMKSQHIPIRFLLQSMAKGSNLSYCTLMNFKHQHTTYITTITKGKGEFEIYGERQQVSQGINN